MKNFKDQFPGQFPGRGGIAFVALGTHVINAQQGDDLHQPGSRVTPGSGFVVLYKEGIDLQSGRQVLFAFVLGVVKQQQLGKEVIE